MLPHSAFSTISATIQRRNPETQVSAGGADAGSGGARWPQHLAVDAILPLHFQTKRLMLFLGAFHSFSARGSSSAIDSPFFFSIRFNCYFVCVCVSRALQSGISFQANRIEYIQCCFSLIFFVRSLCFHATDCWPADVSSSRAFVTRAK